MTTKFERDKARLETLEAGLAALAGQIRTMWSRAHDLVIEEKWAQADYEYETVLALERAYMIVATIDRAKLEYDVQDQTTRDRKTRVVGSLASARALGQIQ